MTTFVLTVGITSTLFTFLSERGYALTNYKNISEDTLCQVLSSGAHSALLLGAGSHLKAGCVERIRRLGYRLPILRLAFGPRSPSWSHTCALFLDAGGDNMIAEFGEPEEVARCIEVAIAHAVPPTDEMLRYKIDEDSLHINLSRMHVSLNGVQVPLMRSEFRVLSIIAKSRGVMMAKDIVRKLYEDELEKRKRSAYTLISRLRKTIGVRFLRTYRRDGYEISGRVDD